MQHTRAGIVVEGVIGVAAREAGPVGSGNAINGIVTHATCEAVVTRVASQHIVGTITNDLQYRSRKNKRTTSKSHRRRKGNGGTRSDIFAEGDLEETGARVNGIDLQDSGIGGEYIVAKSACGDVRGGHANGVARLNRAILGFTEILVILVDTG